MRRLIRTYHSVLLAQFLCRTGSEYGNRGMDRRHYFLALLGPCAGGLYGSKNELQICAGQVLPGCCTFRSASLM